MTRENIDKWACMWKNLTSKILTNCTHDDGHRNGYSVVEWKIFMGKGQINIFPIKILSYSIIEVLTCFDPNTFNILSLMSSLGPADSTN